MSMDNVGTASSGTTKEEQKQLMVSAVEALSSLPYQVVNASNTGSDSEKVHLVTPKTPAAIETLGSRLPAVKSSSVFDRLYKSHTISSKSHTLSSRARLKASTRDKLPNKNPSGIPIDVELSNFHRMAISRSKRSSTPHKIDRESTGGKTFSVPTFATPQPNQRKRPSSQQRVPHTAPSESTARNPFGATPRAAKRVYEFSPRMKPLTKLYFVSKFHPGVGLEPVEPISLGYTFFQTFCEHETGGIDTEQISKEIFIAFFKKDHSRSIRHWKVHEPVVGKKSKVSKGRRGETIYPVTMRATFARGNTYRVAHATGSVRFKGATNKEIWVENFTYNIRGDP
eukprot:jgi/Psemu1/283248/fgenesh1_pg.22_\